MTVQGQPQVNKLKEMLAVSAQVVVLLIPVFSGLFWATGGFTPSTQVAVSELSRKVDNLMIEVGAVRQKLNEMPSPTSLAALDVRVDHMRDQMSRDEAAAAAALARLDQMSAASSAQVRNPR